MIKLLKKIFHIHKYKNNHEVAGFCSMTKVNLETRHESPATAVVYIEECSCGKQRGVLDVGETRKYRSADYIRHRMAWANLLLN